MRLKELLKKIALQPRLHPLEGEGARPVDNIDAHAAGLGTQGMDPMGGSPGTAPPNYVPPVDEGRPRH
jgi:hypothetical protein